MIVINYFAGNKLIKRKLAAFNYDEMPNIDLGYVRRNSALAIGAFGEINYHENTIGVDLLAIGDFINQFEQELNVEDNFIIPNDNFMELRNGKIALLVMIFLISKYLLTKNDQLMMIHLEDDLKSRMVNIVSVFLALDMIYYSKFELDYAGSLHVDILALARVFFEKIDPLSCVGYNLFDNLRDQKQVGNFALSLEDMIYTLNKRFHFNGPTVPYVEAMLRGKLPKNIGEVYLVFYEWRQLFKRER
jgi:hypothetical protein